MMKWMEVCAVGTSGEQRFPGAADGADGTRAVGRHSSAERLERHEAADRTQETLRRNGREVSSFTSFNGIATEFPST